MNIINSLKVAIRGLLINKARSFLTLLGIIIGIAAVITITALAEGLRAQAEKQIDELGTNLLFIFPQPSPNEAKRQSAHFGPPPTKYFSDAEVRAIQAGLRVPTTVSATVYDQVNVAYGRNSSYVAAEGIDENYCEVYNLKAKNGRLISPTELSGNQRVTVLGAQTAKDLFGNEDPIGKTISINGNKFTVIGVLKERGGGLGDNPDKAIQVPLKIAQQKLFGLKNEVLFLTVQVKDMNDIALAKQDIKRALNRIRNITDPGDENYGIISQTEALEQFGQFIKVLTYVLGGVAAVSLLVGGIGIMNIMLVSVTERTREIGLRKAVGARQVDILFQFLIEAVVLCLIGGIVGMIIGYFGALGLSALIQKAIPEAAWKPIISATSVAVAVIFSTLIGLIFGVYPAANAARKDPILALRYE